MKVSRSLPTGLALTCFLSVSSFGQIRVVHEATAGAPQEAVEGRSDLSLTRSRQEDPGREMRQLIDALVILRKHGYNEEARRLREIVGEMRAKFKPDAGSESRSRSRGLDARAERLLRADIQDKGVRVAMLDVVADGYALAGNEESAEAMRWFASAGRSQTPGSDAPVPAMPQSIQTGDGSVMERLTKTVLGGAAVPQKLGNERAAAMCGRLGRFYIEREATRGVQIAATVDSAKEPVLTDVTDEPKPRGARRGERGALRGLGYSGASPHANDLTYIEGRATVLGLAAKAYTMKGGDLDEEERAEGLKWMSWMAASARQRVKKTDAALPPLPGPISMDALIEHIAAAGDIWAANDRPKAAKRCKDLATYYAKRAKGEAIDNSAARRRVDALMGEEKPDAEPAEEIEEEDAAPEEPHELVRSDLDARRRALELEMKELEAQIKRLQKSLERQRRGGGR